MKELLLSAAAKAVNGSLTKDGSFRGVYTDSRKAVKGALFVALEGERFDGHDFIENAEKDGAAAVIARKKTDCSLPVIYVEDTKRALLDLAEYYRGLFDIPVIALTGSVGKTTTKEMTALVCASKYKTLKTEGNLNNDIGMPLTLFGLEEDTQAAVIEMGMNHAGEISVLTSVAKPSAAIITNIGVSHIENLGSRENILKAKLEVTEGMKKGSPLILNGDNDLLGDVKIDGYPVILFGIENEKCQIRAVDIDIHSDCSDCNVLYNGKKYKMHIPAAGIHNIYNALAAFGAGTVMGIAPEAAAEAVKAYVPSGMRQKTVNKNGIMFIEDCYNASPDSVKAAVNTLASSGAKRTVAVLGDMLELGDYSETAHKICGEHVKKKGVNILFTYGERSKNTALAAEGIDAVFPFTNENELALAIFNEIKEGDAVLFKASRGMKLENVINSVYEMLKNKN